MRFWICKNQRAIDAIIKAIETGKCKTERRVESIARKYGATVIWVDGFDQYGNRIPVEGI